MKKDRLIDGIGYIDDALIQSVEVLRARKNKKGWIQWAAIAACFALVLAVGYYAGVMTRPELPDSTEPTTDIIGQTQPLMGVYVNNILYMPENIVASEENVGEFVGYISTDEETVTEVRAFQFLPNNGNVNRIIVRHNGGYKVYAFEAYIPDGTDIWPVNLLTDVSRIEIRDHLDSQIVYMTILKEEDVAEMVSILSNPGKKHSQEELKQKYDAYIRDYFASGQTWLGDPMDLVWKDMRRFVVVKEDNTKLYYWYLPEVKVIRCDNFGYALTDAQAEQIDELIGLE